ncbi:hypothetical protein [Acaryochloris marina]|uniref:hypothetical protein n=1 Tax=Acaryochloris marina TaxID=155978 RepID=UPI001EE63ADE|nr:hypothetical protein [Acaryochloris marina]
MPIAKILITQLAGTLSPVQKQDDKSNSKDFKAMDIYHCRSIFLNCLQQPASFGFPFLGNRRIAD